MDSKKMIKWFNDEGDYCPFCDDELDFQLESGESKNNPTGVYTCSCYCDSSERVFSITVDHETNKVIHAEICCY